MPTSSDPKQALERVLDVADCCLDRAATQMLRNEELRCAIWQMWRWKVIEFGLRHGVLSQDESGWINPTEQGARDISWVPPKTSSVGASFVGKEW